MLDFIDRRADLNNLYKYKLKKIFNSRVSPIDVTDLVFFNCESEQQQTLCLDIKENDSLYLSWWSDLFDFEKVNEKLCDDIFNNYGIFFYFLRIIPSVFLINNNDYYSGKNLFVTFFINQLKSDFSNISKVDGDENKTEVLNYLMYELGLGERYSKYFIVKNNILFFNIKDGNYVKVNDLIISVHLLASKFASSKNIKNLKKMKSIQISMVNFLLDFEDEYNIPYDDFYVAYLSPNIFINKYINSKEEIFLVLINCVNLNQSKCNQFVSDMIYMNYIYYVLREKPIEILDLKKYCGKNNKLFLKIISKIISFHFYVRASDFKGMNLGYYISKI